MKDGATIRPQLFRGVGVGAGQSPFRLACASGGGDCVRRSSRSENHSGLSQRKGESKARVGGSGAPRMVAPHGGLLDHQPDMGLSGNILVVILS